ncbi:MAG: Rrf2 family transcriptional regulator [Planctomycetota bacterium]
MLRLSKKTDYAIFLMTLLVRKDALARHEAGLGRADEHESPLTTAQELAQASGISASLAANLLKDLCRAGLLTSVRGPNGGYRLDRPASAISVRTILEVVEGPVVVVECQGSEPSGTRAADDAHAEVCGLHGPCHAKTPLALLHSRIVGMLEDLSLEDIALHDFPLAGDGRDRAGACASVPDFGVPATGNMDRTR